MINFKKDCFLLTKSCITAVFISKDYERKVTLLDLLWPSENLKTL